MTPTVLIIATSPWLPAARLAISLATAGFRVHAVCPRRHPLRCTHAVDRVFRYRIFARLNSVRSAIQAVSPDLVIPGDESSAQTLHALYERELQRGPNGASICDVIRRSVGPAETFEFVYSRSSFMALGEALKILVPKTATIRSVEDLRRWAAGATYPIVLKADGTSGGEGVRIVHTLPDAERAFRALQAPPLFARAAKRTVMDRDSSLLWSSLKRRRHVISAQEHVSGREATSTVACWNGSVLAALHCEVVQKAYPTGPATVMRLTQNAEMIATVETIVRKLGLSGLHGFDFMIEGGSGKAFLIEINPRSTQVGHLAMGLGRDLPAALFAALSGRPVQVAPKVTQEDVVCLFPQEWLRDPESSFLQSAYVDVPWNEPELLRLCVKRVSRKPNWLSTAEMAQTHPTTRFSRTRRYRVSIPQER